MQNKRIGVVIQGPLYSNGRHGVTAFAEELTDEHVIGFDCVEQICSYFLNYPEYKIVVATWSTEDPQRIAKLKSCVGSENVLLLEERDMVDFNKIMPSSITNNKYKQIFSTKVGAEALASRGVDICVKVRTDQLIDLNQLVNEFLHVKAHRKLDFMVPFFYRMIPDYFGDFFFVSDIATMLKFCDGYLTKRELFESVHCDIFYSIAQNHIRLPIFLIKTFKRTTVLRYYYKSVWANSLCPSSKELINKLSWRGSRFNIKDLELKFGIFLDDMSVNYSPDAKLFYCKSTLRELSRRFFSILKSR